MCTLCDSTNINTIITIETITADTLQTVWNELDFRVAFHCFSHTLPGWVNNVPSEERDQLDALKKGPSSLVTDHMQPDIQKLASVHHVQIIR